MRLEISTPHIAKVEAGYSSLFVSAITQIPKLNVKKPLLEEKRPKP